VDDVLTYALFPQVGLKFIENRGNPSAFEPPPWQEPRDPKACAPASAAPTAAVAECYRVEVDGHSYRVVVSPDGVVEQLTAVSGSAVPAAPAAGRVVPAPLAGTVVAVKVKPGQRIASGELILLLEAMKMETEVRSPEAGTVLALSVKDGDSLHVGQTMLTLG
jgi:oxaloacetate decarboxylase alpha subunit